MHGIAHVSVTGNYSFNNFILSLASKIRVIVMYTTQLYKHGNMDNSTMSLCVIDPVGQAVNIWHLKVYSYGHLMCFAMYESITHALVIRAHL